MTSPRRLRKYALAATLDLCKKSSQGPGCLGKFAGMISGRTGAEQGPSRAERKLLRMSPKQTQARFRSAVFAKPHISATRANLSWTMRLCTAPRLLCLPHSLGLHTRSHWINYSRGANAYGAGRWHYMHCIIVSWRLLATSRELTATGRNQIICLARHPCTRCTKVCTTTRHRPLALVGNSPI